MTKTEHSTQIQLRQEHREFLEELESLGAKHMASGSAIKGLMEILEPHLLKDECLVMPLMDALLAALDGQYEGTNLQLGVVSTARSLKSEYSKLCEEHGRIRKLLAKAVGVAKREHEEETVELLKSLQDHILQEERLIYPTAKVVAEAVLSSKDHASFDACELSKEPMTGPERFLFGIP